MCDKKKKKKHKGRWVKVWPNGVTRPPVFNSFLKHFFSFYLISEKRVRDISKAKWSSVLRIMKNVVSWVSEDDSFLTSCTYHMKRRKNGIKTVLASWPVCRHLERVLKAAWVLLKWPRLWHVGSEPGFTHSRTLWLDFLILKLNVS